MSIKDTIVSSIEAELDVLKNIDAEPAPTVVAETAPAVETAPEPVVEAAPAKNTNPIIQLAIDQAAERLARAPK